MTVLSGVMEPKSKEKANNVARLDTEEGKDRNCCRRRHAHKHEWQRFHRPAGGTGGLTDSFGVTTVS